MESSYLLIERLIVQGIQQQYSCNFTQGVNVIWGDMDSGKSSILNLIDFCLGGNGNELDYDEIKLKGRTVYLQVDLNGSVVTFERVLHFEDSIIKIYNSTYEEKDSVYPKICSPTSSIEQPDGWVSDYILEKLNIPKVKIKESKFRDDANSYRLSFRDLSKLLYLKQKKVASENLMDAANGALLNKNIEIQKFVYGVHDDQLPELNQELSRHTKALSELTTKTRNIREFLKNTESLNVDFSKSDNLKSSLLDIDNEVRKLSQDKEYANLISVELHKRINELEVNITKKKNNYVKNENKLEDFVKLKSTYEYDLDCLKTSKVMKKFHQHDDNKSNFNCPLCESEIALLSEVLSENDIKSEENSLRNRIQGCSKSISSLLELQDELNVEIKGLQEAHFEIKGSFESDNIVKISPILDSITTLYNSKKLIYVELASIEKNIKLKNKMDETYSEISNKEISISKIKKTIKDIEDDLQDIEDIRIKLAGEFRLLMKKSKLSNNYGSDIDNNFLPIFRERLYSNISSGGVRTIMSVNLYISRLIYLIKNGGNLPTFLMMDTPGQNIGRYVRDQEIEDDLSDPAIYEEIYEQIVKVGEYANKYNKKYQMILVDNDLANCLNSSNYHLVKRFDKSNSEFEKGLIFDA